MSPVHTCGNDVDVFFFNCCKFTRVDKKERKVEGNQKEVVKERLSI